ncbi:MAG: hypothetical protein HON14_14745 [Rhodospirillaceae bacterium]|nr:hypothetical protein [Rhodospirillaceae bacterium]
MSSLSQKRTLALLYILNSLIDSSSLTRWVSNFLFSIFVAAKGLRNEDGVMPDFRAVITPTASQ